jgi:hypothetical protein
MPTATDEEIRSRLERLNESMRAAQAMMRQPLLENGAAIIETQRELEQVLQQALREGFERKALPGTLATMRAQAERGAEWFRGALAIFAGDALAVPTLASQLREAEAFLASVRRVEALASAPSPPFDESRLPPAPDGATAEGYISIGEARARVRTKKP